MPTTYAIPNGRTVMDATLYTGTGSSLAIINAAGFAPDLVWIKSRSNAYIHTLEDTVRGVSKYIDSASTAAEVNDPPNFITAFNSNGFTQAGNSAVGGNGATYVGWQWKANGTAVSNTTGSITSSVSANTTSGFSIVTYTGNGTNGASVGHGLGVTPAFFIIKSRSSAQSWGVYHQSLSSPNNSYLLLESTAAQGTFSGIWTPSSSTITFPTTTTTTNGNTFTYVAYCWTPIAGYSAFGSYTGNGSSDGPFIYLGFRPKFILTKRTDTANSWNIFDTSRNTYNTCDLELNPNSSAAENNGNAVDLLSNGFKLRDTFAGHNFSGSTYIYMAFCENPFKFANAR